MYCQYYQLSNLSLSKLKTKMAKFGLGRHFYLIEVPQGWGVTGARPARVAVGVVSRTVRSPMLRDRVVAITRPCLHPVPTGTGTIPGWPRSPLSVNFKVKETYKYMYLRVIKPFKQYTYFVFLWVDTILLGHGVLTVQVPVSVPLPTQSMPLLAGAGFVQVRERLREPVPELHVSEHVPHCAQSAQFPFTINEWFNGLNDRLQQSILLC